jgi:prolyl oligopeptidase
MMFFSSADDDRVDPLHARKMVAALQAANTGKRPIFLRVESHAGHGGADARAADVEEAADRSLFLFHQLGFPKRAGIPWL